MVVRLELTVGIMQSQFSQRMNLVFNSTHQRDLTIGHYLVIDDMTSFSTFDDVM